MIAAAQVRADRTRQAALRARARGHVAQPMSPQLPPDRIEATYAQRLRGMVGRAIERAYAPLLRALPDLVAQARAERGDAAGWRADASHSGKSASAAIKAAERAMREELPSARVAAAAKEAGEDVDAHNRGQLGQQLREVLGIDLAGAGNADQRKLVAGFVHENVKLITGITPTLARDIEAAVLAGLTGGALHEMLAITIRRKMKISTERAELIAVDQVGKINGQVNAARQQAMGITHFVWRTVGDERVRGNPAGKYPNARPSHYARDKVRYAYDDPPKGKDGTPELPGVPIRCRCSADPDVSTVLGEGPVAPVPQDPTLPAGPSRDATTEELEAEADRLMREVEAMMSAQVPAAAPAPPVPAPRVRGLVAIAQVKSAAADGRPQVDPAREATALAQGTMVAYAVNKDQGISDSYRAVFEADGERMRAIVKPFAGVPRTALHPDPVAREVAAANAAPLLGVGDIMPTTIGRDIPGLGRSSAQAFEERGLPTKALTPDQISRIDLDALTRMRAFDFVMGHQDRHDDNVMWLDDGASVKPVLIDNGFTMPTLAPESIPQPTIPDFAADAVPLTPAARAAIVAIDRVAVAESLARDGIDLSAIQGTLYRIAMAQDNPDLLDVAPGEDARTALARRGAAARDPAALLTPERMAELDQLAYRAHRGAQRGAP